MMLVNGIYRARAVKAQLGETSNGNERVSVEFELVDEAYRGKRISWYGYFTEKTFDVTMKALRTCGWQGDDLSNMEGIDANEVMLVIENEAFEGKVRSRVRWVNPVQAPAQPAFGADRAKSFASRMRARIAAFDQSNGTEKERAPAPRSSRQKPREEETAFDNDIPF